MENLDQLLFEAFLEGFNASGEGYNAEYPFGDKSIDPAEDKNLRERFDAWLERARGQVNRVTHL